MPLTIVEMLERSVQGRTEPYICRGDHGCAYFVKGRSAARPGLIAEWLCARLGQAFALPIPPYAIAVVPEALIEADLTGWLQDLGTGEVFASRRVSAVELTEVHRNLVPEEQRRDLLAFDLWVQNGDRNLTAAGGNPNLLWNPEAGGALVVIDHNLAFDPEFSAKDFAELHVFASDIPRMFSDFFLRDAYAARFTDALGIWDDARETLPKSWMFIDQEQTIATELPFARIEQLLNRASSESFWSLQP